MQFGKCHSHLETRRRCGLDAAATPRAGKWLLESIIIEYNKHHKGISEYRSKQPIDVGNIINVGAKHGNTAPFSYFSQT